VNRCDRVSHVPLRGAREARTKEMSRHSIAAAVILLFSIGPALAEDLFYSGPVTKVTDGDTPRSAMRARKLE
jgi:hypothetical protein